MEDMMEAVMKRREAIGIGALGVLGVAVAGNIMNAGDSSPVTRSGSSARGMLCVCVCVYHLSTHLSENLNPHAHRKDARAHRGQEC